MAFVVADRVREYSTTTGTGSIAVVGAATGYQTFASSLSTNDTTYYTIADQSGSNWEVGIGTFTSPSTITRTTILSSSNSGSIVSFPVGSKDVFISLPASRLGNITSASANAFVVGPSGSLNPAFNIDASTASSVTGVQVKSSSVGGGAAISVLSSGSNEPLSIKAKGTGAVTIGTIFQVGATNTSTSRNGIVQLVDGLWAPPGTGAQYYNRYFNIELTVGLSSRGTVSQLWNTQNVIISRSVETTASMANSHTLLDLAYITIPVGVGVGDGGVLSGGLPVNQYYQEIGGYAYNAIILTPGHYNEGKSSYFFDHDPATPAAAGVAAKSSNYFSVVTKNSATNTYSTYGFQAYSNGTQQATYAPTSAFRVDGGWLAGIDLTGQSAGSYGIDMNANAATYAIRIPYAKSIVSRNSGNSADVALMSLAGTNMHLGAGTSETTAIFANPTIAFAPAVDNTITCGLGGGTPLRWSAVWAVNGTIQTSDSSLKTNIQPLPDSLPIVMNLNPATYSWIVGGSEYEEVTEERLVQDSIIESYKDVDVVMIDGIATQVTRTKMREVLLWDSHEIIDEDGKPVLNRTKGGRGKGREKLFYTTPKTHQTPKMVTKPVLVQKLVSKAGKRTHWGFLADEVQKAMSKTDRDFGGYVEDESGTKYLRPDQLLPVLWKAVQELNGQVQKLSNLM